MQENDNLVQLQDENGKDVNFEHLMTIEHEGNYYVVLEAREDTDDCKEGEAIILKIVRDEESDEDVYATIEDEAEFNAVFDNAWPPWRKRTRLPRWRWKQSILTAKTRSNACRGYWVSA